MSFESYSLIVWRFEFVGLYHKFVTDEDDGGGRFVGVECSVADSDGWDGVDGGGGGGDG